jgi:hypothetical protein
MIAALEGRMHVVVGWVGMVKIITEERLRTGISIQQKGSTAVC